MSLAALKRDKVKVSNSNVVLCEKSLHSREDVLVPTLLRGNVFSDAPASNVLPSRPARLDAGASGPAFPRKSVGTRCAYSETIQEKHNTRVP